MLLVNILTVQFSVKSISKLLKAGQRERESLVLIVKWHCVLLWQHHTLTCQSRRCRSVFVWDDELHLACVLEQGVAESFVSYISTAGLITNDSDTRAKMCNVAVFAKYSHFLCIVNI